MARYLVITFDRYETEDSTHDFVDGANSHKEAIEAAYQEGEDLSNYLDDMLLVVSDDFACVSQEESDILSYKLP